MERTKLMPKIFGASRPGDRRINSETVEVFAQYEESMCKGKFW